MKLYTAKCNTDKRKQQTMILKKILKVYNNKNSSHHGATDYGMMALK